MFISIAILTLGSVAIITARDWLHARYFSSKAIHKNLKRIELAISIQDWEKAQKVLSTLSAKGKICKEIIHFAIQVLQGTGNLEKALSQTHIAREMYPEELNFHLEEGKILLALDRPADALKSLQLCVPILRNESDLFALATALRLNGKSSESLEVIRPLLETTSHGPIFQLAGDVLYDLKCFSEAIQMYNKAAQLGVQTHHLFTQLGHAFRRFGNLSSAEKIFRELLENDPFDVDALLGLGACLQERGHHHKALLVYQSGLITKDVRLMHQAAFAAMRTKKYAVASNYFFEVMQKQEIDAHTLSLYGFCLENQKKWQEAEQVYLKLIHLFPSDPQGYRALAWMFGVGLTQTVSHTQGMHFAHVALKLKNDALSWEILSACMARIGQFDKAYQIQIALAKQDQDPTDRTRRQQALRCLRKKIPLGDSQVIRSLVA